MKKLLLALGGVMMISSPANAITWNEFWEPFQSETHVHVRGHGGRHHHHPRRHSHCHNHYGRGYSHCHRHSSGHHHGGHHHYYDDHYYDGRHTEIIIR